MLLYAQRRYSPLSVGGIADRYGRGPSAVSMAVKTIRTEARTNARLAASLERLDKRLINKNEK
jgi:hypothetical protein